MKKPLGKPLKPVAEIQPPTAEEISNIIHLWNEIVPVKYRGILEAEALGSENKARFYWDEKNKRYVSASGNVVTDAELRNVFLKFIEARWT